MKIFHGYLITWISPHKNKSRNLSDANNNFREHNMTQKSSDSHYVHRVFYQWNVYKVTVFTFLRNFQCKSRHPKKKSRNLSDANNKCREHNMTRKSSDSHYVHYVHRVFYHGNVYKVTVFTFLRNFQCKWMLWSIDSRTIIHVQAWNVLWTLRLLCCYWWHLFLLLRFS